MVFAAALCMLLLQTPDYSAEGMKALEDGRFDAAVQAFSKAIAADPKDYFAHFNLGMAYSLMRKDEEGIAEYRKTLEIKPNLYEAELNAGILLMRQKNPADALPLLEDAAAQKPKEFRPRFYLAEAQSQTGSLEKAEESYRLAAALDPKSAPLELGWGRSLARQGKLADAAPHFQQAAQIDPRYHDALLELGELYEQNHQPSEALEIYRQFPNDSAAQQRVAALLLAGKQYADAIPRLEGVYAKDPTVSNGLALAQAFIATQQTAKAIPLLEKAAAEDSSNYDLRMAYAGALRDLRQFPAAAAQFNQAARIKPQEVKPWLELGGMLYLTHDFPGALGALDHARQLGDESPGPWFLRAIMLDNLKQLKPALDAYQHFLSLSHDQSPDQEFQARQRARLLQRELDKR
jgi:tetratricopeptide (TPR) repeat protein